MASWFLKPEDGKSQAWVQNVGFQMRRDELEEDMGIVSVVLPWLPHCLALTVLAKMLIDRVCSVQEDWAVSSWEC